MRVALSRIVSRHRRATSDGAKMRDQSALASWLRKPAHLGLAATVLLATVQGCTSVPDAANPVEWYKGARDWVSGDDANAKAKKAAADAPEIPGKDRPFPKVSSVPEAPARSTAGERQKSAQSLIADRDRARYSDEVIRRQTASATSARTPSAAPRTKAVVDAPPPRSNTEPKVSRTTVSPAPAARPSPPAIPRAAPAPPAPKPAPSHASACGLAGGPQACQAVQLAPAAPAAEPQSRRTCRTSRTPPSTGHLGATCHRELHGPNRGA